MSTATGSLARFGLIALLALALGALLLFSASPAGAQSVSGTVDYDTDGDNLIEVATLAQLNAIRHDLDGNGDSTHADYTGAFPNALASMGCAASCTGYELTTDLDFDTDSSGAVDSSDTYASWSPIGTSASPFVATFDGGGHTILKMTIRASGSNVGLFGGTSAAAIIRNLALLAVDIDRATGRPRTDAVGAIVGFNRGRIERSYATGSVQGVERVGGLAGDNQGTIANSYANVTAGGSRYVGGLAGRNHGSAASITNSYNIGSQSAKSMVYSTSRGGFDSGVVGSEGGIVGANTGSATVSASYWNSQTSSSPWSYAGIFPDNFKKTTAQLQSPTGATGIYSGWSAAIWDFGTASQYPALLYDTDGDSTPSAYEFGRQGRSAPEDYDSDDNGLIEVDSLVKLNAIRWDLDGNGASTNAGYALAFPTPATGMGCPVTATDADDNDCLGYELTADLDFNTDTTGSSAAVIDSSDDYWDGGLGWSPIASESTAYMAVFDGGRHTIANLFINRPTSNMVNFRDANKSNYVGLFASLMSPGEIRHLRLTGVSVTGRANVGSVVGHITQGTVSHVSSTGAVTAVGSSGGNGEKAGGLVGSAGSASVVIEYSYSTATVTAGDDYAGGLIGESKGEIRASYATGAATATGSYAGGLVGKNDGPGIIKASYATGAASGADHVGGLAGQAVGNILSSYSRGAPSSSSSPAGTNVGGLVGSRSGAGTITNSYWDVTTSGLADDGVAATGEGKTTIELQSPTQTNGYAGIYANWNLDLDSTAGGDDPWDFGTASEYPALKADFNRDSVKSAADGDFGRQPRAAPVVAVDYDLDDNNLIEVSTLAQLNAIRHDLDGNGDSTHADYTGAFLNAAADMGCAATCLGYELTADLDFDENGDSQMTEVGDPTYWNTGSGWAPIGGIFTAIFNGNGHVIKNLFINRSGQGNMGLFGTVESRRTIGNLGLENVNITGGNSVGPLAGTLLTATVERVYATGSVTGRENTGGLVGFAGYSFTLHTNPTLRNTYSRVAVTGTDRVSGLVGYVNEGLTLTNSYFAGTISGTGADVGSLVGRALGVTAARSYWDGDRASGAGGSRPAGASRTTSELQTPTGATGIYSGWSAAIWDFGTASQYPALKYDTNEDSTVTWQEFGSQVRSAPANNPPVFTAGYDDTPNIAEGETAVGNYAATDPESDALTYAVAGTDAAAFAISGAGVLTLNSAANHETKSSYIVSVTVHDGKDAAGAADTSVDATLDLTVTVDDTLEPPGVPTGVNVVGIVNGLRVSWTAADAAGKPAVSFWVQYAQRTSAGPPPVWDSLTPISVGGVTTYDITGLTPGETYQVFVRAVNAEGNSLWTFPGQDVPLAPPVVPPGTVDYDRDDDGLIDVDSLDKLNAIRWDLNGDGASANAGYATAFPNPETGMGCPVTDHDGDSNTPDQPTCTGYELTADLDFDTHGNDDTVTAADTAYWNGGSGWDPIGSSSAPFAATFDGAGHAISNLFINRGSTDYIGLFRVVGDGGRIRNLGLERVKITGRDFIGAVAGGDVRLQRR